MRRIITEGFIDKKTPDLKYYAFDWDDNIVHMPTKIILLDDNGDEVLMGTEDFAKYRSMIGNDPFNYKGKTVVGFAPNPLRYFRSEYDNEFIEDSLSARPGPAFSDFREAVNNGSIFAIITARGHSPEALKESVRQYIENNYLGINKKELIKNLKKYRTFVGEKKMSDDELITSYLELNKYHPVSYGNQIINPEEAKVEAMENFVAYVKAMAALLNKKVYLKKDIANKFDPSNLSIGFSDDDPKNIETMYKHFSKKPDNIVKTYSTATGTKQLVNKDIEESKKSK